MEQFRPAQVVAEDAALTTSLQAGDEDALRTFVGRFGGPVFAVVRRSGADHDAASARVADVFLDAWRLVDDVEPGADLAPWLAAITADRLGPGRPSDGEIDVVWGVRAAVDAFDDRDLVRRRAVDRCTAADLAAELDVSEAAVAERLARADRRLGGRLEPVRAVAGDEAVDAVLGDPTTWELPPDDLADRVVAAVAAAVGVVEADAAAVSRRPAWVRPALLGAMTAIVALFAGVVVLSAVTGTDDREAVAVELTPTGAVIDAAGTIELIEFDAGVRIDLTATALPRLGDGAFYQAWVGTPDGGLLPVGTFRSGGAVVLFAGLGLDRVESFQITRESVAGADDASQSSSGDVVLRAALGG